MRLGQTYYGPYKEELFPWLYEYKAPALSINEVYGKITVPKTTGSWFESLFMLTGTQIAAIALVAAAGAWWIFKKR